MPQQASKQLLRSLAAPSKHSIRFLQGGEFEKDPIKKVLRCFFGPVTFILFREKGAATYGALLLGRSVVYQLVHEFWRNSPSTSWSCFFRHTLFTSIRRRPTVDCTLGKSMVSHIYILSRVVDVIPSPMHRLWGWSTNDWFTHSLGRTPSHSFFFHHTTQTIREIVAGRSCVEYGSADHRGAGVRYPKLVRNDVWRREKIKE